jgi:hypothetical protein
MFRMAGQEALEVNGFAGLPPADVLGQEVRQNTLAAAPFSVAGTADARQFHG